MYVTPGQLTLSPLERKAISLLVVESDTNERDAMRRVLQTLGYGSFHCSPGHTEALITFSERPFSHVMFSVRAPNMPVSEFLGRILRDSPHTTCIPSSYEPNMDDVFSLLQQGARGYLVKPFSADSVDSAMIQATKGEPFAEAILTARDRNEVFAALIAGNLDKYALITRQAESIESARRDLPKGLAALTSATNLAKTFCRDGEAALLETMVDFFITLGEGPATKLGRLRHRLKKQRLDSDEDVTQDIPWQKNS